MNDIEKRVLWIKEKTLEAGANGLVIAISGGVDSAVVAALAKKAFPNNTFGIFISIGSSTNTKRNFLRTINALDIKENVISLTDSFEELVKNIFEIPNKYESLKTYEEYEKTGFLSKDMSYLKSKNFPLIRGNIKARLRMISIYALAQLNNYLVLGTSNLSEIEIGYYTKWGDGVSDIEPISDLNKREVIELAKKLNIPKEVINSPPSADLWEGQTDEGELGFTYDELEKFINNEKIPTEVKDKIIKLKKKNNHKIKGVIKYGDN